MPWEVFVVWEFVRQKPDAGVATFPIKRKWPKVAAALGLFVSVREDFLWRQWVRRSLFSAPPDFLLSRLLRSERKAGLVLPCAMGEAEV